MVLYSSSSSTSSGVARSDEIDVDNPGNFEIHTPSPKRYDVRILEKNQFVDPLHIYSMLWMLKIKKQYLKLCAAFQNHIHDDDLSNIHFYAFQNGGNEKYPHDHNFIVIKYLNGIHVVML